MSELDKSKTVLRSMDSFQALRSSLAYLRSVSIILEDGGDGGHLTTIEEELKATTPEQLTEAEFRLLSIDCSKAAICTHVALLYTAVCFYKALVKVNPALRHDKLDEELEAAKGSGLDESMREARNAVFHIRPSTRPELLINEVVKRTLENKLSLGKIEDLLYDATEKVFRNPETLFQEKEEVPMEGYRRALAYYEEHLSKSS